MALYLIKDTTLIGIADAIRSKTGSTDPIAVTDMATQISGITGGGSVEGAHTITFMSEDGSTTLGTKQVMNGDTCGDPVALGVVESTPTKESTAQYEYTFNGWSTTAGGEADSNALTNVTGDRTVYAAFKADTRAYVIRFLDGETVLQTMVCEYGTTPSYTPDDKDGWVFASWSPELVPVTCDADYYAQWDTTMKLLIEHTGTLFDNSYAGCKYLVKDYQIDKNDWVIGDTYVVELDGVTYEFVCRPAYLYGSGWISNTHSLGNPYVYTKVNNNTLTGVYTTNSTSSTKIANNGLSWFVGGGIYETFATHYMSVCLSNAEYPNYDKHTIRVYKKLA